VAAAGVALVLTAGATFSRPSSPDRATASSAEDSSLTVTPGSSGPPRPLTYAEGQTIHLGNRTIDTHLDLLSLDVTDDGAAFTTLDGYVWFTDGSSIEQIGFANPGRPLRSGVVWGLAGRPNDRVVSAPTGSRLAWVEFPRGDRPEIVVYDTHRRDEVARVPVDLGHRCRSCGHIVAVRGDDVFWTDRLEHGLGQSGERHSQALLARYSVSTGKRSSITVEDYQRLLRRSPRMLVVGPTLESGTVESGINQDFAFIGEELVAGGRGTGRPMFDPVTGRRLVLRVSPRYGYGFGAAERLYLFQWLDDDRFALLDGTGWNSGEYRGEDLLVCRLSTGRCTVAVRRPPSAGSPIVPEIGSPGAEQAQDRAARSLSGR
jgi:hypothetical protein